jgi:hypothetical protein
MSRAEDPFAVATEHVVWCLRQEMPLDELHEALGFRGGASFRTWNDAIWTLARIYSDLAEKQHKGRGLRPVSEAVDRVMARVPEPEPFRQREPPPFNPRRGIARPRRVA